MKYIPSTPCADNEREKLASLEALFRDWRLHLSGCGSDFVQKLADEMVFDGFHPNYFNQKTRILFIGREARGIAGCNYIDLLYHAYRDTKRIGYQHINRSKFHARMLNITYGLCNGMPPWEEIPYASDIGDTFGTRAGVSFAFMNISKLSNEGDHWSSDWRSINACHDASSGQRNFNREQIAILTPDIIITMNLGNKLPSLGDLTPRPSVEGVDCFEIESNGHRSLLLDTFHFSAPRKSAARHYYNPICDVIRQCALSLPA